MTFMAPWALLWGLLAVPIVLLYVLRVRQRRVAVPTVLFWDRVFDQKRPRSLFQRLRHPLSLLMQLLILALLLFALARPLLSWQALEARELVLIVDRSASTGAADVAPSRLDAAKDRAREVVAGMRFFDHAAVIAADAGPKVVCGRTNRQRTLREAIEGIEPTDGPSRIDRAVALAERLLADRDNQRIVILSDGAFPDMKALTAAEHVRLLRVGGRAGNLGITRFQVRRSLADPLGYQTLVEVANFSDEPAETTLELTLAGEVIDVVPLSLEPGERWSEPFEKVASEGGRLEARLLADDALVVDNTARAVLPERKPTPITLLGPDNLFLQKAFEAMELVSLRRADEPPEDPGPRHLTVYHREVPETLPEGNALVIDPRNGTDLWELGDALDDAVVGEQAEDAPLMAHVQLDNVYMPEARRIEPTVEIEPLARAVGGEPLYFAIDEPERKTLVLSVNLAEGDLPLRTAFPIMVTNALNWFAGAGGELRPALRSGEIAGVRLPDDPADRVTLTGPGGARTELPVREDRATVGPLDRCGVWTLTRGEQRIELTCNLARAEESDLRPPEDLDRGERRRAAVLTGRPPWFYLLAIACGLMVVEWWLYQRRHIT